MEIIAWFIAVSLIMWILGPVTQVLQVVAPTLHTRLGLMEAQGDTWKFPCVQLEQQPVADVGRSAVDNFWSTSSGWGMGS